jgi:hypothetical protein
LEDIEKGSEDVAFKALGRNCVVDLLDGVIRNSEFIAVQIKKLAIFFALG